MRAVKSDNAERISGESRSSQQTISGVKSGHLMHVLSIVNSLFILLFPKLTVYIIVIKMQRE